MRVCRGTALSTMLLMAVVVAAPGVARAQSLEVRAAVTLTGAYSETLTPEAYPITTTNSGPSIALSPSIVALIDTPRTTNSLSYAFTLTAPFAQTPVLAPSSLLTYSNRFTYTGHYDLDELTGMNFGVALVQTPIGSLVPSQDPTAQSVQALPAGVAYLVSATGNEAFSRQLSERNTFTQAGSFAYGDPIVPGAISAQTYSAQNTFGLTRTFSYDSLGVTLTNQLAYFTASQDMMGDVTLASTTYLNTLSLNWLHPFTERLSGTLTAGVTQVITPDALSPMSVQPTGSAVLTYTFNYAIAALSYSHAALPNMATATVDFNDMVSLRFSTPVVVPWLIATGTAGFTHSVPVLSTTSPLPGVITGPVSVYLGDAALEYHPKQVPTLTVGVRGLLTRQVPTSDPNFTNTYTRYTVALNLTYSYPNWNAAAVRPPLAPELTAPQPSIDTVPTDRYFVEEPYETTTPAEAPPEQ